MLAGEINFHFLGVAFQVASIISESVRLCLIQILLQSRGIKLNPISTLYYIAPACFMFLLVPFVTLEAPAMLASETWIFPTGWMILSAVTAFGKHAHTRFEPLKCGLQT